MLTSMKLRLTTTVAALSIAAVTSAGAAVNPTSAVSASAAPARPTFEMQAQARFKCWEDLGYGRTGLFGCGG